MESVIKTVIIAVIAGIIIIILKQSRPEYAMLAEVAALICVFALCAQIVLSITDYLESVLPVSQQQRGTITIILKTVVIAVLSKTGADICRDSGSSALAFAVETAGNAMILLVCMPLIDMTVQIISGLLKG